jgi:aminopeptidase N
VRLTQSRFKADGTRTPKLSWRTPVFAGPAGAKPGWEGLVTAAAPKTVPNPGGGTLVVNAGQTGYFRTAYAPALWARLSADFMRLAPSDQLGLLRDSQALGEAGLGKLSDFLALSRHATAEADPIVLRTLATQLSTLDHSYDGAAGQAAFRAFVRARLDPVLASVGWDAKPGETPNMALLRTAVLETLGQVDDPQVTAEAHRRIEAWLSKPDSLTAETRRVVLAIASAHADAQVWEALHAKARAERDPTQKERYYAYLGASHDPALARRALDLALTDEPGPTLTPEIVSQVSRVYPDLAYDFALAHRTQIEPLLEPDSRVSFYPRLAAGSREAAMLGKLDAFAATIPASTVGEVRKAEAQIRHRREVIDRRLPEVTAWLAAHPG